MNEPDLNGFITNPTSLVALCRRVAQHLAVNMNGTTVSEKEMQFRVVAMAVEQLEKLGTPVPDALRSEKIRLSAEIDLARTASCTLRQLSDDLALVVREIKQIVGHSTQPLQRTKRRIERSDRIPRQELRNELIAYLKDVGGRAALARVFDGVGERLDGQFRAGDLQWFERGKWKGFAWHSALSEEAGHLKNEGIMRRDSPRGFWELTEVAE